MTDPQAILPNFLIAGVPKAGTSSVHGWLADHPDCVGSIEKETYFLVDPGTHMHRPDSHISGGLAGYAAHFPPVDQARIVMESTPGYICSDTARRTLADMPGAPKVLFILREPADQIYSLFRYFQNNWDWIPSDMTFSAFLAACRAGTHDFKGNELARDCLINAAYVDHLRAWQTAIGSGRMKVMLFDDLLADQSAFLKSICAWLEIEPSFFDDYAFPRANETYAPRSRGLQSLNIAIRNRLPKGAAYNALRGLYRRLNTRAPDAASDADDHALAQLRRDFEAANAQLAKAFDLDLSRWSDR
ncbi:sulfotransferase domain-containing protein [Yoonia sp. R2331]|uniref:sulfotransferase domain-containing protein n=1 Tax=Yoonia sp. R2331 TaxID=3237238 RepID=UPI0034E56A1D